VTNARYTTVAVVLHWAMAILIVGQIAGGFYMHGLPNAAPEKLALYQLHKSFGLSVLALALVRLGWRLAHRSPALPETTPGWQKLSARAAHWLFYGLMIATPLAGWAIVSVSPKEIPTIWFGLFEVPHLPFFGGVEDRYAVEEILEERHETLAFAILFLLALHVGAAIKHGFFDRDGVLRSMAPASRNAWLGIGAVITVLSLGAVYYAAALSAEGGRRTVSELTITGKCNWIVDREASTLSFAGEEKGRRFEGQFEVFDAEICFSFLDPGASKIRVVIATDSAATGEELRDSTITASEWFGVKTYPTATFEANGVTRLSERDYKAAGVLRIKEYQQPVMVEFTLDIEGGEAVAIGGADLVRTDFGLGLDDSWLEKEKVGLNVRVDFEIHAIQAD